METETGFFFLVEHSVVTEKHWISWVGSDVRRQNYDETLLCCHLVTAKQHFEIGWWCQHISCYPHAPTLQNRTVYAAPGSTYMTAVHFSATVLYVQSWVLFSNFQHCKFCWTQVTWPDETSAVKQRMASDLGDNTIRVSPKWLSSSNADLDK